MHDDGTAHASLKRRIDLTAMADSFVLGWKQAVMIELDRMRAEMPYADTLELKLICERNPVPPEQRDSAALVNRVSHTQVRVLPGPL